MTAKNMKIAKILGKSCVVVGCGWAATKTYGEIFGRSAARAIIAVREKRYVVAALNCAAAIEMLALYGLTAVGVRVAIEDAADDLYDVIHSTESEESEETAESNEAATENC